MIVSIHGIVNQKQTVAPPAGYTLQQTVNIDFEAFSINPIPSWNIWIKNQNNGTLLNSNGISSGFQLIDQLTGVYYEDDEAFATVGDSEFPDAVLNRLMYLDASQFVTFNLTGLNPNNRYDFTLGCFIMGNEQAPESQTSFFVFDQQVQIPMDRGGVLYKGTFDKIQPDANGIITIKISGTRPNDFGGFNGLIIREYV